MSGWLLSRRGWRQSLDIAELMERPGLCRLERLCAGLHLGAILCAVAVLTMFLWEYQDYNSSQYRLETDYLHWTTPLPAITVCEVTGRDSPGLERVIVRLSRPGAGRASLAEFLEGLLTARGGYCVGCKQGCDNCPRGNYSSLLHEVTRNCSGLLLRCVWRGKEFDCCHNFQLLITRDGKCFSVNSLHTPRGPVQSEMFVSHSDLSSAMDLFFSAPVQVFVHDRTDLGFKRRHPKDSVLTIPDGHQGQIVYGIKEVRADPTVRSLTEQQRGCSLDGEHALKNYRHYSRTACREECLATNMARLCNCTHHLMAATGGGQECDYEGLICLDKHFRAKDPRKRCKCMRECEFTEINIARSAVVPTAPGEISVRVELTGPPSERLTLHARVTSLDILVGLACLSRLFTSTNLVRVMQGVYYTVFRLYRVAAAPSPP